MSIKNLILLSFLTIIFILPPQVLAVNEYLTTNQMQTLGFTKYESINGNSLLYPFKKLREKIFRVPDQKLFDTRFNELVYTANKRKTGFLESAVESYISITGRVMESKNYNQGSSQKYLLILEKIRDGYPSNTLPWIKIQQAIETTKRML